MPAEISPLCLLLAAAVVALGSLVQGAAGFGAALVAAPLLALIHPRLVPAPLLVACFVLTVLMAFRDREGMDLTGLGWAIAGRVPGTLAGAWVLLVSSAETLGLGLGVLVLAAVAMSAVGPAIRPQPRSLFAAGVMSGFMGTTTSVGGPPMALLYQHAPGSHVRGTLAGYFVIGAMMSMPAMAAVGRFGTEELLWAAAMTPGVVLGFILSGRLTAFLDGGWIRHAVVAISALAGLTLLLHELT